MTNVLAVAISLLAVLVAAIVYLGENRRADLEVARSLHLDLTSGEVAGARRLLGTLRYGDSSERGRIDTSDALTAYFTLLWCFERVAAGRRSLLRGQLLGRRGRAVTFLDEAIDWHLIEWREGLPTAKSRLNERLGSAVDDDQSREALRWLLRERALGSLRDEVDVLHDHDASARAVRATAEK